MGKDLGIYRDLREFVGQSQDDFFMGVPLVTFFRK